MDHTSKYWNSDTMYKRPLINYNYYHQETARDQYELRFKEHKTPQFAFGSFLELQEHVNKNLKPTPDDLPFTPFLAQRRMALERPKTICRLFWAHDLFGEYQAHPIFFEELIGLVASSLPDWEENLENHLIRPMILPAFLIGHPEDVELSKAWLDIRSVSLVDKGMRSDYAIFESLMDAQEYADMKNNKRRDSGFCVTFV